MKIIKGVLVDVEKGVVERKDLEYTDYKDLYPLLKCRTFDIQTRRVGVKTFDVYLDDEGLMKENHIVSGTTFHKGKPVEQFVGNLFICHHTSGGNIKSLTEEEQTHIINFVRLYHRPSENVLRPAIMFCL